ncbi:sporulation protein [Staphylospora marina]|uniref:sporulation protein n=1 Tax=Staphylospora marina TaxID=2490858 RepID=UPI000F5B9C6F|nr:sporulation protein [Staphylospora marina]
MFKKFLARLGKGSARVDLVLEKDAYRLGEEIRGELVIQGGTVEQDINKIDIDLMVYVRGEKLEQSALVNRFSFPEKFTIGPSEVKSFPFQYTLPENLLVSGYSVSYAFITHLDIAGGVDSSDRDPVTVLPPTRLQRVLEAFQSLGFQEKYGSRSFDGHLQEFEMQPTDLFKGEVEEIEFCAVIQDDGIALLLETDVLTFAGEKEIKRELWLENSLLDNPDQLAEHLRQVIAETVQQPHVFPAYDKKQFSSKFSSAAGAIGAFAIGLITVELLEDALEDAIEEIFDNDDDDDEEGGDLFGNFFGGDEED